jgi:hypothetical protein
VREDTLARLVTELAVHEGGEPVSEVLLGKGPIGRIKP